MPTKIILALFFFISFDPLVARADVYHYSSLGPRERISINLDSGYMFVGNFYRKINDFSSRRHDCIEMGSLVISFPRDRISLGDSWVCKGRRFRVVRAMDAYIIGEKYGSYVIYDGDNEEGYWFLFSQKKGMLAIGARGKGGYTTFMLEERCGFFSSPECKELSLQNSVLPLDKKWAGNKNNRTNNGKK